MQNRLGLLCRLYNTHKFIFDSIVVIITVTGVSNAIAVHIPLTTVRDPRAVVLKNQTSESIGWRNEMHFILYNYINYDL